MFKIRWSHDRLIVNMGIPVPGKEGLCMRQGPGLENNHPIVQQPSLEQRRRKAKELFTNEYFHFTRPFIQHFYVSSYLWQISICWDNLNQTWSIWQIRISIITQKGTKKTQNIFFIIYVRLWYPNNLAFGKWISYNTQINTQTNNMVNMSYCGHHTHLIE